MSQTKCRHEDPKNNCQCGEATRVLSKGGKRNRHRKERERGVTTLSFKEWLRS